MDSCIKFLESRALTDPIAHACLQLLRRGATAETAILCALGAYANNADEARKQLSWHMERYSVPVFVAKKTP